MPHPSKDLADLADQLLGTQGNTDLAFLGEATTRIRSEVTKHEEWTRPFVATLFWQAYLGTRGFQHFIEHLVSSHPGLQIRNIQIVAHGTPQYLARYDLLLFAEGLAKDDLYISADAKTTDDDLRFGSSRFLNGLGPSAKNYGDLLGRIAHPDTAQEVAHAQSFKILVFPAPKMIPAAQLPHPPWPVSSLASPSISTAGVWCNTAAGKSGVTASFHAVRDAQGGQVDVGGQRGRIISTDFLSDSVFVEVALPAPSSPPIQILSNLVPRQHEAVDFTGVSSGRRTGRVMGWSPQLPFVSGNSQLVVTTDPISAPGDSGSALRDQQGCLLGFCHEASAFGVANPYSSWIWAESVFKAHQLV